MMTLNQSLYDAEAKRRAKRDPAVTALMDRATQDLAATGLADSSLKVGRIAPDFSLPNVRGEAVSLSEVLKRGPVILSFYRGGWCPHCNMELHFLQRYLPQFKAAGASLIAISPQTPDASLSTAEKAELEFEVLSDLGNKTARDYGLVFTLPKMLHAMYANPDTINLWHNNGDKSFELPVPATFIVDAGGVVCYAFANADYSKRAEPEDILHALKRGR